MDILSPFVSSAVNALSLQIILPAVLLGLVVYVLTWNYRWLRKEPFSPDLLEGEQRVDHLPIPRRLAFTETWLSDQRVIQAKASWFLSRRKVTALCLGDVNAMKLDRMLNAVYLVAGLFFWGTLNPVALGLFLFGLENPLYAIRFEPSVANMPLSRITCLTFYRRQLADMIRFWRNAVGYWAQRRMHKGLPAPIKQAAVLENLFGWGRPVWCYLAVFFAAGILQRIFEPHLSFDDFVFLPLYLGLPAAVASRSGRDAVWSAILGFATLLTVLYPVKGPGVLGRILLTDDYAGRGLVHQQLLILLCMVLIAGVASALARYVHPSLTFLAPLLWLAAVGLHMPSVFYDLGLYAKVAFAMFAAGLLSQIDRALFAGQ